MTHTFTIRSSADLLAAWQFVDQGFGYAAPQIFALMIESDGSVVPQIVEIHDSDLDGEDREQSVGEVIDALKDAFVVGHPGSAVAVMRARPGRQSMTADDATWCRLIHEQLARAGLNTFPMYFATDDSLGPVPPDVLVAAA